MRGHEQVSVWRTHLGIGPARDRKRWYHQLRSWWTTHQAACQQARLATLQGRCDAQREAIRSLRADAAPDMIAPTHARATATALYTLPF